MPNQIEDIIMTEVPLEEIIMEDIGVNTWAVISLTEIGDKTKIWIQTQS